MEVMVIEPLKQNSHLNGKFKAFKETLEGSAAQVRLGHAIPHSPSLGFERRR